MIGLVALIIFGPRKLPQMMRTVGKAVAEFRRSTDDFKRTWEKEVNFEDNEFKTSENSNEIPRNISKFENSAAKTSDLNNSNLIAPEIREINRDDFSVSLPDVKTPLIEKVKTDINSTDKRNWL